MGVIRKKNPKTGEWEIYGSTEAKDINIIDAADNFSDKNVEGALREISDKLSKTLTSLEAQKYTLIEHSSEIEWLKEHGGGGGGNNGASAPTITSTFESCSINKEDELTIPIFFSSPNLGEGTAYVIINNVEVASITGIKQGNNDIFIGKLTELNNTISIYVKDRTNMLSNQLTWQVTMGGIDLTIDFDDTADYFISDEITMQYYVSTTTSGPITMYLTIDYDNYEIPCSNGFNEYILPQLGVGVHTMSLYVTDGVYTTPVVNYNIVIVNSTTLYVSTTFRNDTEFVLGDPVQIQYRVSKASNEYFDVNLYLNDKLVKTLSCNPGTYYWTIPDLDVGTYNFKIEVSGAYDSVKSLERTFLVVSSGYEPIKLNTSGMIYRLSAKGRTNQDSDRDKPIDDSGNGVITTLHNFNWFSNGWINDELVCDGESYVEIDLYPWAENALYGSTIEIHYTALDIGKDDARILDYTDIETPYKGLYVDIEEASIKSLSNNGLVYTDKDVDTTLSFVIDRKNKFAKVYINGICSRAFSLSDSGSGTNAVRENFIHAQKMFLNSKKGVSNFGACKIKDLRVYGRVLSDDEIVTNYISQITNLREQEKMYNFNFNNTTLPVIRMYGDMTNMTLETPVNMRVKYTSPNEDEFGQSFDLPYCPVCWQGTSSLQYVLKNFTVRLRDENMSVYEYSPYPNGVKEDVYCFKCDYMESTHARNVGIAKFVNACLYDTKNPKQMENPNIRNSINGFPCALYINDELQGIYNFNLDRYSTKSYGYTDEEKVLVYEISANSDTTAGAFYSWNESTGKAENDYYQSDYECLYPPSRASNDSLEELKRLITWVDKSSDEDFKDNIGRYFNLEYLLRYYLFTLVFGAVDSLGKNAKLASFDGGMTWYFQVYDADTTCGLNNSGFLLFGTDIEMGDENVFNTTGSRLWQRVVLLFQEELKEQYAIMRQGRFTVDNIMKYLYGEQISRIPATYYNKDMQSKYLDFGSSYLYALHGSGENHLKKWIRERLMYVDTLLGYMVSSSDYITIRSNKLGYVYLDIQSYIPMYVSVKWRDEVNNAGMQTKKVRKGETVRFEYNMPTATDQEILVYAGHYIKSLGNLSNLQPSTLLIANANRLTEIECHSPNLINTDLSQCTLLQKIDISDCTALGTGVGAQPILNIKDSKYLRYLNCSNTQLTAIYTMDSGSNLEEIYYPESIQTISLKNQAYLRIVGIPYEADENGITTKYCKNLANVEINTCKNIEYLCYPYSEIDGLHTNAISQVQKLTLIDSLDNMKNIPFKGFSKLKELKLSTMHNITTLNFDDMLSYNDVGTLETVDISDCPLITNLTFNISNAAQKIEFVEGAIVNLGGMQSIKSIESNATIKGLKTLIIPTSVEEIRFVPGYSSGENSIRNIWSAAADHSSDGFEGMDLLDVSLTCLDMRKLLKIKEGINFSLTPIDQNPNMNLERYSNFFKPEGTLNLTNYTGSMQYMLKGIDLEKLDVIIGQDGKQTDLTGLFEYATLLDCVDKVNDILGKYPSSTNWTNLFRNATVNFDTPDINIPKASTYKNMNLSGMFNNTSVSSDIVLESNIINASNMFKGCKNMVTYKENWNNDYYQDNMKSTGCYSETGGNLELIPVPWGGYGFFDNVTSEIIVKIPNDEYSLVLTNKYKTLSYGIVNWGDGTIDNLNDNKYTHVYKTAGTYTIKGHFTFGLDYISNTSLNSTLLEVKKIAQDSTNLSQAFKYCTKLQKVDLSGLTISSIDSCFSGCTSLTNVVMNNTNTDNITNMEYMFASCSSLTSANLSKFNTENVTSMTGLFYECGKLKSINMGNINTENVTDMSYMFYDCSSLTNIDLSKFNTENVTDMAYMFYNCKTLTNINTETFDTGSVESMEAMFNKCSAVTSLNLSNFNTSKVTNMAHMFYNCVSLTSLNISTFETDLVVNMSNMFYGCKKLEEIDVSNFNTSNVTDMKYMFADCGSLLSLSLDGFITDNVTNMSYLFYNCEGLLTLDVTKFNTENVIDMSSMFFGCTNLAAIDISGFIVNQVENMYNMFSGCKSITELNLTNFIAENVTNIAGMFNGCKLLTSLDLTTFNTEKVYNMSKLFYDCNNLTSLNISTLDTRAVKNMSYLFYNCNKLESINVSSFDTTQVTDMSNMFYGCIALSEIDVSNFNTSNVTDMRYMFYNCSCIEEYDLTNFNVDKVSNASYMFYNNTNLKTLKLDNLNASSLTGVGYMFYGCESLETIDMNMFNTSKLDSMTNMFNSCSSLRTLDLSKLDTSRVTNMSGLFSNCNKLESIDLTNIDTTNVNNMSSMFNGCYCDISFTNKSTTKLVNAFAMFNTFYGETIDLTGFSIANSTNNNNFVTIAPNLVNFIAPNNINKSITITAEKLSVESLMSIINNLNIVKSSQILEIGETNLNKLSDEQKAIAINKNWTLC